MKGSDRAIGPSFRIELFPPGSDWSNTSAFRGQARRLAPGSARMPPLPVVHSCTHLRPLGGVQSLLRRHLRQDDQVGLSTSSVIWFERGPFGLLASGRPVAGLGLRWFHSGKTLRRRLRRETPGLIGDGAVWAYHELWGLPTAADLDRSARRLGIVHSQWEAMDVFLRAADGLLDGVLCVSTSSVDLARTLLPSLSPDRIAWLPLPVDPPKTNSPERGRERSELVIGYCGRIQRHQKRVERLPEIARCLRTLGVAHRWELLGAGPEEAALKAGLASAGVSAQFHGVQTGDAYWKVLANWDLIVFTSDFEGLPIAMLEAMSQGVIPIFPEVICGGRDYAAQVAPELVYPAADLSAAAQAIAWVKAQGLPGRRVLELRARKAVAPHGQNSYGQTVANFAQNLAALPRVSAAGDRARRAHPGERFPFGFLGRLPQDHRWRQGYLQ